MVPALAGTDAAAGTCRVQLVDRSASRLTNVPDWRYTCSFTARRAFMERADYHRYGYSVFHAFGRGLCEGVA